MKRLSFYSFAFSLALHLSLLLVVALQTPAGEGDGSDEKQVEVGGGNRIKDDRKIAPRPIEVSVVTPTVPKEGDLDLSEPEVKKKAADCEGDNWYGGIGITQSIGGSVILAAEGYPAALAGIKTGDVITKTSDEQNQENAEIRGEVGSRLRLVVYRPEIQQFLIFDLIRGKICLR
jgi:hypothetical protein